MSDIKRMQKRISQFCYERDWDQFHGLKDLAIGLSTEAAEVLELFRFQSPEDITRLSTSKDFQEQLSDELADTLFFILRMAERSDIDLSSAFEQKMQKNSEKYPVAKAFGNNTKYTEL